MQENILSKQLRKAISLVDMLRDLGLQNMISLPKIVVLGNQSSGKSSLVEQIVGIDFLPRGIGVVTRRPLELRMNKVPELKIPYAEFDEVLQGDTKKKFSNFNQVRQTIIQVTNIVCSNDKDIKDIPIILNIFSQNCPNLTIVDLPGITLIPVKDQPSNIYQITRQMAIRYIKQPRSIILCVIPANQDITNSESLHLTRQVDPNGQRSIGCLTKIDIMNRGDDITKVLTNLQVPLKYGYVGVKNRCQFDIDNNISVAQSLKKQKQYFSNHPVYSRLPNSLYSTESLIKRLTSLLYEQIKTQIPNILNEIQLKKNMVQKELDKLGPSINKEQDLLKYVWASTSQFLKIFNNSINGIKSANYDGSQMSYQIRQQLHNIYKVQQDENILDRISDRDIEYIVRRSYAGSILLPFPTIDAFFAIISPTLRHLRIPAQSTNNKIYQIVNTEAFKIIDHIFIKKFPKFNTKFGQIIKKMLNKYKNQSQKFINLLLEAETNYLYTNSSSYLCKDFSLTQKEKQKAQSKQIRYPYIVELRKRVSHYYRIVIKNLRDLVPKQIINFLYVKLKKQMQFQTFKFSKDTKKLRQLLNQPKQIQQQRNNLREKLTILTTSQNSIRNDTSIYFPLKQKNKSLSLRFNQLKQNQIRHIQNYQQRRFQIEQKSRKVQQGDSINKIIDEGRAFDQKQVDPTLYNRRQKAGKVNLNDQIKINNEKQCNNNNKWLQIQQKQQRYHRGSQSIHESAQKSFAQLEQQSAKKEQQNKDTLKQQKVDDLSRKHGILIKQQKNEQKASQNSTKNSNKASQALRKLFGRKFQ